ncbi:hypothetical protein Tco_0540509 [Tanacetum coccineum]
MPDGVTIVMLKYLNEPQIGDIELSKVTHPSKRSCNLSVIVGSVGYVPPGSQWVSSKSKLNDNLDQILDSAESRMSPATRDQMLAVLKVALACVSESPKARSEMRSVLRMLLNVRN